LERISGLGWVTDICSYSALAPLWDVGGFEDSIRRFEDNDVSWFKEMVMKTIVRVDPVSNISDGDHEGVEVLVMWPVVNDTLEPLQQ